MKSSLKFKGKVSWSKKMRKRKIFYHKIKEWLLHLSCFRGIIYEDISKKPSLGQSYVYETSLLDAIQNLESSQIDRPISKQLRIPFQDPFKLSFASNLFLFPYFQYECFSIWMKYLFLFFEKVNSFQERLILSTIHHAAYTKWGNRAC